MRKKLKKNLILLNLNLQGYIHKEKYNLKQTTMVLTFESH